MDDIDYQKELCLALKISPDELTKSFSIWRFNVLHVRGLNALTSEDVYEYFHRKPHSIEWLSNISCNVTFECINEAFESLISIAKAIIISRNDVAWEKDNFGVLGAKNLNLDVMTAERLEIPVPPNFRFVVGEKHPKAKTILIRFATINDRKDKPTNVDPTAPKEQIITATRRSSSPPYDSNASLRRVKRNEMSMDVDMDPIPNRRANRRSTAPIRMRMRADEEEERLRQQQRRSSDDLRSRLSNRSRIGDRISFRSSNDRIMKSKQQNDSIWRRTIDDTMKNRMRSDAKSSKKFIKSGNSRIVGDLRNKLNEPIIRVQITYDDDVNLI